jgi:hypothetical protein
MLLFCGVCCPDTDTLVLTSLALRDFGLLLWFKQDLCSFWDFTQCGMVVSYRHFGYTVAVLRHWYLTANLSNVKFQKSSDLFTGFVCCLAIRIRYIDSPALQRLVIASVLRFQV